MIILKKPNAVICDIEGTTTSLRYWEECLGPTIWLNARECLKNEWNQPETKDVVSLIRTQMTRLRRLYKEIYELPDKGASVDVWIVQIFKYFKYCIDNMLITDDIISLQVLVAFYCFRNKICQGHVYEDTKNAFIRWKENNIQIGIYSSGISLVQQLLFAYSCCGNLHSYIKEFFSSAIDGEKTNQQSYCRVAKTLGIPPSTIVYVSDNIKECVAAKECGFYPVLMVRNNSELNNYIHKLPFKHITNFDQLRFAADV